MKKQYLPVYTKAKYIKLMIESWYKKPIVRAIARDIILKSGLRGSFNTLKTARAIFDWVKRNITYINDPVGLDEFANPVTTYKRRYGDCEDLTILLGSLYMSIGIPVKLKIIPATKKPSKKWHIYLLIGVPKAKPKYWIPVDASGLNFGQEYTRPKEYQILIDVGKPLKFINVGGITYPTQDIELALLSNDYPNFIRKRMPNLKDYIDMVEYKFLKEGSPQNIKTTVTIPRSVINAKLYLLLENMVNYGWIEEISVNNNLITYRVKDKNKVYQYLKQYINDFKILLPYFVKHIVIPKLHGINIGLVEYEVPVLQERKRNNIITRLPEWAIFRLITKFLGI